MIQRKNADGNARGSSEPFEMMFDLLIVVLVERLPLVCHVTLSVSAFLRIFLVAPLNSGEELTIWDWRESEFASGLELKRIYE